MVRNHIIALSAAQNTGKTKTLLNLIDLLKSDSRASTIIEKLHFDGIDKFYVCNFIDDVVAVITIGDPGSEQDVLGYLKECVAQNATVIFAACRTFGETHALLVDFCKSQEKKFQLVLTRPYFGREIRNDKEEQDFLNALCAKSLFSTLT